MLEKDAKQVSDIDTLEEITQPTSELEDKQENRSEVLRSEALTNPPNQAADTDPQNSPVKAENFNTIQTNKEYEFEPVVSEVPADFIEPTINMPNPAGNGSSNWMSKQSYDVYACSNVSAGPQSVFQLRKYYTQLDNESRTNPKVCDSKSNGKNSIRSRSKQSNHASTLKSQCTFEIIDSNEDAYGKTNLERCSTSVEELRKIFENADNSDYKPTSCLKKMDTQELNRSKSLDPIRPSMGKSIEFYMRPPNIRTPSPKNPQHLPTPPPLPLPPFPDFEKSKFRHDTRFGVNEHPKCLEKPRRRRHYSSHWNQPAQPIISMSLPFRSRSLALDRLGDSTDPSKKLSRFRAGSLTQRSLSPINLPSKKIKSFRSTRPTILNNSAFSGEYGRSKINVTTNTSDVPMDNLTKPMSEKSLVRNSRTKNDPDHIIYINPSAADGVYVRSAVVYERVHDQNDDVKPRNFLTTYVVTKGPYPSRTTVQATNLWVAEQAIQQSKTYGANPPHRTQLISNFDNGQSWDKPDTVQVDVNLPSYVSKEKHTINCSESLSKPSKSEHRFVTRPASVSPLPLPEPPPTDVHPKILRCVSRDCSPTRVREFSRRGRGIQFNSLRGKRSRHAHSPLGRSWSVKSLSPPPPFRTQWLSSLSGRREHRTDYYANHTSESVAPQKVENSPCRFYSSHNKDKNCQTHTSCYESYRMERARRQVEREREEWMHRAEEIHRDRKNYHEFRGSWSPPQFRSPPRHTPNDIEEPTEQEIRKYVKYHSPPSPGPKPPLPNLFPHIPVEYVQAMDKSTQYNEPDNNYRTECDNVVDSNCIDTTPIAEKFDEKKAFFEDLIRTNKELARCSFCSDCFHCSPMQTPHWSAYSSWDSDLHETYKRNDELIHQKEERNHENNCQNVREKNSYQTQVPAKISYKYQVEDNTNCNSKYRVSHVHQQPIGKGPQQYASSIYLASADPYQLNASASMYDPTNTNKPPYHDSIQHEFYAKPTIAMPKVAPDPPNWTPVSYERDNGIVQRRPLYTYPLRVELAHSPVKMNNADNVGDHKRHDYHYRPYIHSPPCRFSRMNQPIEYALHRDGSVESLHCDQYEQARYQQQLHQQQQQQNQQQANQPFYQGRVRQLVQELDKRATEYGIRMNSGESFSTPDLRRSMRRSESERFSYFMPQT